MRKNILEIALEKSKSYIYTESILGKKVGLFIISG